MLLIDLAAPAAVRSQDDPATTTSSTTTTTEADRLLIPEEPSTTTTAPPSTSTTQPPPPPPEGQQPIDDAGPTEVPQDVVVVPPAEGEVAPDPYAPILQQIAGVTLAEVQKGLRAIEAARLAAASTTTSLSNEVAGLEARMAQLEADKAQAVARLEQARLQVKKRAVAGYMGSPAQPVNQILASKDFNDLTRRFELLQAVVEADRHRIGEYDAARAAVGSELAELVTTLDTKRATLAVAASTLAGADDALLAKQVQLAAVRAGSNVVGGGFVFPVAGPRSYSDTFGAPRMFGTSYAHLHQGTDIFAAQGTPLVAVERGVLIKVGTDVLGGTKLWLVGASGTRYYYAHLSAFAEGTTENKVVAAGEVVGYVGNTGNAITTPPHVHFEVHPGGGAAVNPYPLLRMVDDAQRRFAAPGAATPPTRPRS